MTDPTASDRDVPEPDVPEPPSKAKLAWATLAALVVAGVVLVSAVLPAEYDIDPLGIGEALGCASLRTPWAVRFPYARMESSPTGVAIASIT